MKTLIGKSSKINFAIVGTQMSQLFCPMTGGPMQLCSCHSLLYLYWGLFAPLLSPILSYVSPIISTHQQLIYYVTNSVLLAAAECLNQHSEAVKLKLDNYFENWDFFADDFDHRVRNLLDILLGSGLMFVCHLSSFCSLSVCISKAKVRD